MKTNNEYFNGTTWNNGLSKESMKNVNKISHLQAHMDAHWGEMQSHYRSCYPELANADLSYRPGQYEELTKRIAQKTFRTPQEVTEELENWTPNLYKRYGY